MEIEEFDKILNQLTEYFSILKQREVERKEIFNALFLLLADEKELEWEGDLWDIETTYEELKNLLLPFDFGTLQRAVITEDEIVPYKLVLFRKVRIKDKGQIWVIHKNDKDPKPSNPHAHNLEMNIKLDLSNGDCFRKQKWVFNIGKEKLISIREKAKEVYKGELPDLA